MLFRIRHHPGPPVGAQVAREGPRAAATPAQRQPAESSPTLECPGQVPLQSLLTPLPPGCAPRSSARRGTQLARGLDGGLQERSGGPAGSLERPGPQCRTTCNPKAAWWAAGARAAAWPQVFLIPPHRWPKGNNLRAQCNLQGAWCCLRPERARRWRRGRDAGTRRALGATNSWGRIEAP